MSNTLTLDRTAISSPSPDAELCRRAANLIEEHGWVQGYSGNPDDGFCMMGAIWFLVQQDVKAEQPILSLHEVNRRYSPVARRITKRLGGVMGTMWNDAQGRTKEQVIAFLRDSAEAFDAEDIGPLAKYA